MKSLSRASFVAIGIVALTITGPSFAEGDGVNITAVQPTYSCEDAKRIKFSEPEYEALPQGNQFAVDMDYQQCKLNEQGAGDQVVAVADPNTPSDRVYYGLVARNDLKNAQEVCQKGGKAVGIAVAVGGVITLNPDAVDAGNFAMTNVDVACSAVSDALEQNNLMLFVGGPGNVAAAAVAQATLLVTLKSVGVSDADLKHIRAWTKPPSASVGGGNIHIDAGPIHLNTKLNPF